MPTDTPLASQQALVAGKGKLYQPWATRQATPRGLINYQVPGGAGVDVTYSGANPSLFDFNQDTATTTNGNGTTTTQLQDWQQPGWDYRSGVPQYKATGWTSNADWYAGLYNSPAYKAAIAARNGQTDQTVAQNEEVAAVLPIGGPHNA